jgi:WhiB family redox-sensing transcriptional regulator
MDQSATAWFSQGRCLTEKADPDLFSPDTEAPTRLALVRSLYCGLCPVRALCLTYALETGQTGFWGGTSTEQRKRFRRRRNRLKCPDCKAAELVRLLDRRPDGREDPQQICPSCGLSWKSTAVARAA